MTQQHIGDVFKTRQAPLMETGLKGVLEHLNIEKVDEIQNKFQESLDSFISDDTNHHIYIALSLVIVSFIVFFVLSWVYNTLRKKDAACGKLNKIYKDISRHKTSSYFTIHSNVHAKQKTNPTNYFDNQYNSLIKNYYIKTAYNACCGDGYKNNFVNICALEKCIEVGARCLDFEIYSYNGEPIVASSTANNNSIKETYNYIKLTDVFDILREHSFDETKTSAGNDPMFLHFRIMSENKTIYDKFGDYIKDYLIRDRSNIVDYEKYNYKNNPNDDILLKHLGSSIFNKKFIIMVNTLHVPILDNSKLSKYVHIRSGSKVLRLYRYEQVIAAGKNNPLMIDESHRSLIMVLPNIDNTLKNYDPLLPFNNGCQFVAMKFQNIDNNLVGYYKMFKDSGGFSFVLKPNNLRKDIIPPEEPVEGIAVEAPETLTLGNR
jgi:hypothetical protein